MNDLLDTILYGAMPKPALQALAAALRRRGKALEAEAAELARLADMRNAGLDPDPERLT